MDLSAKQNAINQVKYILDNCDIDSIGINNDIESIIKYVDGSDLVMTKTIIEIISYKRQKISKPTTVVSITVTPSMSKKITIELTNEELSVLDKVFGKMNHIYKEEDTVLTEVLNK